MEADAASPGVFLAFLAFLRAALEVSLLDPLRMLASPHTRIYVPYLLGSLVIAFAWSLRRDASGARVGLRAVWQGPGWASMLRSPSFWLDLKLLFFNVAFRALLITPLLWSGTELTSRTAALLESALGQSPRLDVGAPAVLLYAIAVFIADDFSRFFLHWLLHRIPWLWRLHRVHHSAELLTPLTLYRAHPLERALYALRALLTTGLVTGCAFYFYGAHMAQLRAADLLGVNAFVFAFQLLGANLRHSHVWLPYPAWLERALLSPAQHQMHHWRQPHFHHGNLGAALAVWDEVFGTWRPSEASPRSDFGLPPGTDGRCDPQGLLAALVYSPKR